MKTAPKGLKQNIAYRRALMLRAQVDQDFRHACYIRAKRDPIWYCDSFGFTYSPKEFPNRPVRPFILWDYQERGLKQILDAVGKHDLLGEKSRDTGFTWLFDLACEHLAHFFERQSILLLSRKEALVDGDPDSLMWKIDFFIENLPGWLRPRIERTSLEIRFLDTHSVINGESTNSDAGRGGRRTLMGLDEFPAVDNGHEILRATRDVTNTRVFIGTPQGASGAYYDTREKFAKTHPDRILRFHWSEHPLKRVGLYSIEGCDQGKPVTILDKDYKFPPDFDFLNVQFPQFKLRSIWFNAQCDRAASPQEIAQELEIDYAAAGWQFFDAIILERLKRKCRAPEASGEITFDDEFKKIEWMDQGQNGRLKLWFRMPADGKVPDVWDDCNVTCDIAAGKGGELSSNSVAAVSRRRTGEKIAEFASNIMFPPDFANYAIALCKFFNNAYLSWESNGYGGQFGTRVTEAKYSNLFYGWKNEALGRVRNKEPGWVSNKDSKRLLLIEYAKSLIDGAFVNPSIESMNELGQYVHEPSGDIIHARSKGNENPANEGVNHGDRVIADALGWRTIRDGLTEEKLSPPEPPPNSMGGRRLAREREASKVKRRWGRSRVA
jgi:hypothetical protein